MSELHGAAESASGYLYQCRQGLLLGLRAAREDPKLAISIEKFDDVAFEAGGDPKQLIQTKHHIQGLGALTDSSADLWKTILIWSKVVHMDVDAPFRTAFILLTTGSAPKGSAASYLRTDGRDEQKADEQLLAIAQTASSKANAAAHSSYKALTPGLRLSLLRAIRVLDNSPTIVDVRGDIVDELRRAAPKDQIENLVDRLEGWWFNLVIRMLNGASPNHISVLAIETRVDELREEFKRTALPVDFKSASPAPEVVAALDGRPFVRQLRLVEVGPDRIEYAIRDYYRASEQRSRWVREELLIEGELDRYEKELIEAWQPRFAEMKESIGLEPSEEVLVAKGRGVFSWVEQVASFPFRSLGERFLTHGSYHILSNRFAVGWHPNFKEHEETVPAGTEGEQ